MALQKLLLVAALPLASALESLRAQSSSHTWVSFDEYVVKFGRSYRQGTHEYVERYNLYQERVEFIRRQNSDPNRLWTAGINHLTDRTEAEFKLLQGWRGKHGEGSASPQGPANLLAEKSEYIWAPKSVSWHNLSATMTAEDQGSCGSCWAMATSTMLSGRYEVQTKTARTFSVQQLVNCVQNPLACGGSGGCDGATVELAMDYIHKNGLHDTDAVPYIGNDQQCVEESEGPSLLEFGHSKKHSVQLSAYRTLPSNKALPLMHSLIQGPVAISVGASDWMMYQNGIFNSCLKDVIINHAVTLIGYGEDNGINYWTIQNSWGPSWGEGGHMRLFRHGSAKEDEEFCGTDYHPEEGIACKPYPESVRVCGMCGILYDSVEATFASKPKPMLLKAKGKQGHGQGRGAKNANKRGGQKK
mmetsp:Transcript_64672/g.140867  ORF Transcript_64672/g.140867 Transcript_64672/m.140867 type:complete len:415 (-) Transcript_64672:56-1300(-)|eukprot:CAMPEP_0170610864 /NCGR_PEP_ID=MMETSP0224-20130122/22887_1 /TAXON_ID=285029 /ORGANISM="Togula jolla, Strain CCCM 725" /LENGTH=414 /DNA_ID=CAMNT_0010936269 /DNA_START=27 /DNA_END=1271 /DNA_ORIENTATION=-